MISARIAKRYVFVKRNTNAINIITGISVFGVGLGAAALILVLSVFNGFEDLIVSMYNTVNPALKITPKMGKSFEATPDQLKKLRAIPGVEAVSETLEEVAFFEYKDNQAFGVLKGVDYYFNKVNKVDTLLVEGQYQLANSEVNYFAVLGMGMRNSLSVNIDDPIAALTVYMPKQQRIGAFDKPFRIQVLYPTGTVQTYQEFDTKHILCDISVARTLLGKPNAISSLEVGVYSGFDVNKIRASVQNILGAEVEAKNRYQQEESFMKLMKMEKWLSYAIVGLMMLLISFNMIGALWMTVLEKRKDISILRSMGATDAHVFQVFMNTGMMLTVIGLLGGFILAGILYVLQKQFGLISMPGNMLVPAYPIELRFWDFVVVLVTVLGIGCLASLPAAIKARSLPVLLREE